MELNRAPYSYRDDRSVPAFPDVSVVCVMDAQCGLCAKGARWIARNDRARRFRIVPVQSHLGGALLRHYGMDADDTTSWLVLHEGRGYGSLDAIMLTGRLLGGKWHGLSALRLIPVPIRDALYATIARYRRRLTGTRGFCDLPDPAIQERILT